MRSLVTRVKRGVEGSASLSSARAFLLHWQHFARALSLVFSTVRICRDILLRFLIRIEFEPDAQLLEQRLKALVESFACQPFVSQSEKEP